MLRRAATALLLLFLLAPGLLSAQYFGRNRVQYSSFDFKIIQTEHFDVYYYEQEQEEQCRGGTSEHNDLDL